MDKISKDIIIDTAEQLIEETDKAEVSIPQIAKRLGITHSAIYKHFENKQDLWEAVAQKWFNEQVFSHLSVNESLTVPNDRLKDWLWQFVTSKKKAYLNNEKMFTLNTKYIDNNPYALQKVLLSSFHEINRIMDYDDTSIEKAQTILSSFSIFTLPNFREFWDDPSYAKQFEDMWSLIKNGL